MNWILDTDWFWLGCFLGFFVQFARPLPRQTYAKPMPRKGRKQKAATNRKTRTVQLVKKAKAKKETAKKTEWTKPPIYTPADIFRIEEMFRRGRGEQAY